MELYLVRHGQSIANLEGRYQGIKYDTELTDKGIFQAYGISEKLKNHSFDLGYVSGLKRAKQTADIINKRHGLEMIEDIRLNEIDRGDFAGLENNNELWKNLPGKDYIEKKPPNGENDYELKERVGFFLDDLLKNKSNEKILIVSHGGTMLAFLRNVFPNTPFEEFREKYPMPNACLYKLKIDSEIEPRIIQTHCSVNKYVGMEA